MSVQSSSLLNRRRVRRTFGKIKEVAQMPNLIEVQRNSYEQFLQMYIPSFDRTDVGLQAVFNSVFPIKDFTGRSMLEFVSYTLEEPKYDVEECHQRGLTFSSPLRLTLRLIVWDIEADTGTRSVRDMKEQDVYMGDMPLMTPNGTFVVNGTERVIVSQMHRSPGVFFDHDKGKSHASGKYLFAARVIPYRGSWLDFEFDPKDILNVRIDRRRKLPCTTLLMALLDENSEKYLKECKEKEQEPDRTKLIGMTREDILNFFYENQIYKFKSNNWTTDFIENQYKGVRLNFDLIDSKTGKVVANSGDKMTPRNVKILTDNGLKTIKVDEQQLIGKYIADDIINIETGEVYAEAGDEVTEDLINLFKTNNLDELKLLLIDNSSVGPWIRNTLALDKNASREESLVDIYRVMRPGEPPAHETAEALFPGTCTGFKCLDEGRRIIFTQQIGEEVDLGGGDFIAPNLMWGASLDSSWPSLGMHYLYRLWCMNQERLADVMFKVKRTTRHDQILLERSTILADSMGVLQDFIKHATFLRQIKVSNSEFERMLANVVPKPEERFNDEGDPIPNTRAINAWEKKRSAIRYYYKEEQDGPAPGTAWAVWNAVQSAESHELTKSSNPEKQVINQVDQLRSLAYPITNAFQDRLSDLDNSRMVALV